MKSKCMKVKYNNIDNANSFIEALKRADIPYYQIEDFEDGTICVLVCKDRENAKAIALSGKPHEITFLDIEAGYKILTRKNIPDITVYDICTSLSKMKTVETVCDIDRAVALFSEYDYCDEIVVLVRYIDKINNDGSTTNLYLSAMNITIPLSDKSKKETKHDS